MSYTYLASPYSHPDPEVREQRFQAVCRAAARLMREGEQVFSPIAHTHPIAMAGCLPGDWEFWREYDEEMLSHAGKFTILTLRWWSLSKGVHDETVIARRLGLPIEYMAPDNER